MQPDWEAVIGLEVHVQLRTRSKMFCSCANAYGAEPNTLTCPVCLGLPGALPVLNGEAVRQAVAFGLAVGGRIQPCSAFFRKQYFYPDLPKGYQITQGPVAVVEEGSLEIPGDPRVRGGEGSVVVRLERAHLEEDAGKSTHGGPSGTLVDLNRAGVPLLEIVGAPDLRSPQEASDYLKALHHLVSYLELCDGNLEEGSFRCDANISLRPSGTIAYGTRVEIKNLNSFRFVRQALEHEVARQSELLEAGQVVAQETRGFDAATGVTRAQRSKEGAHDYRYFPEPDLPDLVITAAEVEAVKQGLPELPWDRARRFQASHRLSEYEAGMLVQTRAFADFFEAVVAAGAPGKAAANWMLGEVSRLLNERGVPLQSLGLAPELLGELVRLTAEGAINLNTAREGVLPRVLAGEGRPSDIIRAQGLAQVSDLGAVQALVAQVLTNHPSQVAELRGGNERLRGFLVGQVMKAGGGKVNPRLIQEALEAALRG